MHGFRTERRPHHLLPRRQRRASGHRGRYPCRLDLEHRERHNLRESFDTVVSVDQVCHRSGLRLMQDEEAQPHLPGQADECERGCECRRERMLEEGRDAVILDRNANRVCALGWRRLEQP